MTSKAEAKSFFEKYADFYNAALAGHAQMDEITSLYSSAFVAVTPYGVVAGENDAKLKKTMEEGYADYRRIGSKGMSVRDVAVITIDEDHFVANVQWAGDYERKDGTEVTIDFEIKYFVEKRDGALKVFGWIAGDEQAEFEKHGLL